MSQPKIPPSRSKAIAWARDIVANEATIFLDTETTGLGPEAEICDLGIVRIDGTVLIDSLVRPSNPIPEGATAVHGITNEMVESAEPWAMVYRRLLPVFMAAGPIAVYNRDYDLTIINQCSRADGLDEFGSGDQWQCAMLAMSDYLAVPGKYPGQFRWHKLDAAVERFGIPPGGHRALADAETTRRVVLAMAADTSCDQPPPEISIREQAVKVADDLWQQAFGRLPR